MKNTGAIVGVIVLVGAAAAAQWFYSGGRTPAAGAPGASAPAALRAAAAKIAPTLPRPYVSTLVFEAARAENDRLVIDVHITDIRLAQMDKSKIPQIQKQELGDLAVAACADPDQRALLRAGYRVARRFLDQDHKLVFEVAATEKDCGPRVVE
jgi:hypothetical protein